MRLDRSGLSLATSEAAGATRVCRPPEGSSGLSHESSPATALPLCRLAYPTPIAPLVARSTVGVAYRKGRFRLAPRAPPGVDALAK